LPKKTITIIGSGVWGLSLARILKKNNHDVVLWTHSLEKSIALRKQFSEYKIFNHLAQAVQQSQYLFLCVSSPFVYDLSQQLKKIIKSHQKIVCATKGFDIERLESVYTILKNHFSEKNLFVLSGPNIAKEINAGLPAATVVAGKNFKAVPEIQKLLNTSFFRVYGSKDPVGVHLGGTFKNTYAIVAGIAHGLKLGDNAISAMMVRALAEMKLLAVKMGAQAGTLDGLSGAGDLMTTCYSVLSRNHHVGIELAKGKKLNQILKSMNEVAEGVLTCKAMQILSKKYRVLMPITNQIFQVLYKNKKPQTALAELMKRPPSFE
jgi:glycerol-3-phosphate dehydrogenase (NAD(P)+)